MKRIVWSILFLLSVAWGWKATADYFGSENLMSVVAYTTDAQVVQKQNEMISVLQEANNFPCLSARLASPCTSLLARRYRPAGFSFDNWMVYRLEEQKLFFGNHFKMILSTSQEYGARQKYAGYYIYSLRRIIV